jgi:NADPH:quinone reductase-like Zn-dependent oxidoreductase
MAIVEKICQQRRPAVILENQMIPILVLFVKALVFDRSGLDNLKAKDIEAPSVGSHDVLIKIKMAGVNPIDYRVVSTMPNVKPMPHIPGTEFAGTVEEIGSHVSTLKKGDKVTVYNRVFDGSCDMCLSDSEMLCRNGGIIGVVSNGGYAEYVALPEKNVFKVPDDLSWEMAASLPVAGLTPYHALRDAELGFNQTLIVLGASGNTGMFAVQLGRRFGAKVIAVSRKAWPKDFGADHVVGYENAIEKIRKITSGKMADVVLNSLGLETWSLGIEALGLNSKLLFFGTLTGGSVSLGIDRLYGKQTQIIGTTGGTRKELNDLISVSKSFNVRIWKKFGLDDGIHALKSLSSKERDGRILLEVC